VADLDSALLDTVREARVGLRELAALTGCTVRRSVRVSDVPSDKAGQADGANPHWPKPTRISRLAPTQHRPDSQPPRDKSTADG
jgi:hypothetical protein